jgi:hypothetical protein
MFVNQCAHNAAYDDAMPQVDHFAVGSRILAGLCWPVVPHVDATLVQTLVQPSTWAGTASYRLWRICCWRARVCVQHILQCTLVQWDQLHTPSTCGAGTDDQVFMALTGMVL